MSSISILPSIGPAPPQFRRALVPDNLRPKLVGASENKQEQPSEPAVSENKDSDLARRGQSAQGGSVSSLSGFSFSLSRSSAVAVQVQESASSEGLRGTLSDEEKTEVKRLGDRDREVRAHEAAHATTGGAYTGTPSFEYVSGPDGIQYAVGGHVDIDISAVSGDPKATIAKMEVVQRAALAPAQPSGQDRSVAAVAAAKIREAETQLAQESKESSESATDDGSGNGSANTGNNTSSDAGSQPVQEISLNLLV